MLSNNDASVLVRKNAMCYKRAISKLKFWEFSKQHLSSQYDLGVCIQMSWHMRTVYQQLGWHSKKLDYWSFHYFLCHYDDVIMDAMASQITSLTLVYSTVYSGTDQRKHQSSSSLAFVWGIHRGPVNSPHKWPVTWKMFPFDDVIMVLSCKGNI